MCITPGSLRISEEFDRDSMTKIILSKDMTPSFDDKDACVSQARLCDSAGRFEDMVKYIKILINIGRELNDEEIALVSYAYKNLIKEKRKQYKTVHQIYADSSDLDERKFRIVEDMRNSIAHEIKQICLEVINLLDKGVFPKVMDAETRVCYLMMKADHFRYLAEVSTEDKKTEYANISLKIYQEASDISKIQLTTTNPVRLNLALNLSVLYYDVLNSPRSACIVAKQAFDEAILDIENLNEENLAKTTLVMKLLTDNLTLWEAGHQETVQNLTNDDDDDI